MVKKKGGEARFVAAKAKAHKKRNMLIINLVITKAWGLKNLELFYLEG